MHTIRRRNQMLIALFLLTALILSACGGDKKDKSEKKYTVGILNSAANLEPVINGFKVGMAALGYTEGQNIEYVYSGPVSSLEALEPEAQNLKTRKLDLVLAIATTAATVAQATFDDNTPILFVPVNNPVELGLVERIAQPGGNITGIQNISTIGKALEMLAGMVPGIQQIYVLHNPNDVSSVTSLEELTPTAETLGITLVIREVTTAEEVVAAAQDIPDDVQAMFLVRAGLILSQIDVIVQAANEQKLPVGAPQVGSLNEAGLLIGYGSEYGAMGKQAASLGDRILKGTKPATLPVETAEAFLWINLKTAEAIGFEFPDAYVRQADNIVRPE